MIIQRYIYHHHWHESARKDFIETVNFIIWKEAQDKCDKREIYI